jgi:ENTS family enterobactin (siderophore) exporter
MQRSSFAEKRLPIGSPQIFLFLLICLAIAAMVFVYNTSNPTRTLPLTYTPWNGSYSDLPAFGGWILSSLTEPEFYTCAEAGIGLMAGALFAQWAHTNKKGWRGFVLACGSGLWPSVASSALIGLICSNLIWGWSLGTTGKWQPTFVPLVSVAPAVVLLFGPGLRVVLTGAILGAILTTPISLVTTNYLCTPFGLPPVVGVTTGMWAGALLAFCLCRVLPWMPLPAINRSKDVVAATSSGADNPRTDFTWAIRRILADFSEAQFFGNEWASGGLVLGALMTDLLSPAVPVYGSGLFVQLIIAQFLTSFVAVFLWRRQWAKKGFFPTFVPVVSVAPAAVLALNGSGLSIVGGALLGAIVAPPLAAAIAGRLPEDFHPFIGNVASMTISTALIVPSLILLTRFC